MPATIVIDSWAMIAFLEDEPAARAIEQVLVDAVENDGRLLMTVVNLGEVWYSIARRISINTADETIRRIHSLGIEIRIADWELTHQAAHYKARFSMAYADCFSAALAFLEKAVLLTGDKEYSSVEKEIQIQWV